MTPACTCLDAGRCIGCGETFPLTELWATPYEPQPGERELAWCIACGGETTVTYHCTGCHGSARLGH
jgi:hypothetical protein